jgi:hypothetical protein
MHALAEKYTRVPKLPEVAFLRALSQLRYLRF